MGPFTKTCLDTKPINAKDASFFPPVILPRYYDIDVRGVLSTNLQKFKKQQLVRFIFSDPDISQFWQEFKGAESSAQASVPRPVVAEVGDISDELGSRRGALW